MARAWQALGMARAWQALGMARAWQAAQPGKMTSAHPGKHAPQNT